LKVKFESSFARDLRRVRDLKLQARIADAIRRFEDIESLLEIDGLKKLKDEQDAYRLRIGEYRLGFLLRDGVVVLVRFLDRKDIYRYFP